MNCSICGAPLPPDGICRNVHPATVPNSPLFQQQRPDFIQNLHRAAWFAPVSVFLFMLSNIVHLLLDSFVYNPLLLRRGTYSAYYGLTGGLGILRIILVFVFCVLLYRLATGKWEKDVRKAHAALVFVPFAIFSVTSVFCGLFNSLLDYLRIISLRGNNLGNLRFWTLIGRNSAIMLSLLEILILFFMSLIAALISYFVVRSFLNKAKAHLLQKEPPIAGVGGQVFRLTKAAWFAPVAFLVFAVLNLVNSFLQTLPLNWYNRNIQRDVYLSNLIISGSSILANLFSAIFVIVFGFVFYRAAAGKWGKLRRDAYKAMGFLPYTVYLLISPFSSFVYLLFTGLFNDGLIRSGAQMISLINLISGLVFFLIEIGVLIPIAIAHLKRIETAEGIVPPKGPAPAPVSAAQGYHAAYGSPAAGPYQQPYTAPTQQPYTAPVQQPYFDQAPTQPYYGQVPNAEQPNYSAPTAYTTPDSPYSHDPTPFAPQAPYGETPQNNYE